MTAVNTKYTPGPWKASIDLATGAFAIEDENRNAILCSRAPWGHRAEESAANARLIAAAPDLVEALDGLVMVCGRTGDAYTDFEEQADAFHKETGWMRPGKSMPMELRDERSNDDARRERYAAWVASKIDAARAALSKAGV